MKKKGQLYLSFFTVLIIIIFSLLLIQSLLLAKSFENIIRNRMINDSIKSLEQSSKTATLIIDNISKLTHQIYYDKNSKRLLDDTLSDYYETNTLVSELKNYININTYIDSVYIYNDIKNIVYTGSNYQNGIQDSRELADTGFISILRNRQKYAILTPIPRLARIKTLSDSYDKKFYSFIYYDWLNESDIIRKAICVNISSKWLNQITIGTSENTIIVNNSNKVISDSERYPMMYDISREDIIRKALLSIESGYYMGFISDEKVYISYTAQDINGWRYIKITPYNEIKDKIESTQFKTFLIVISIMVTGFIISFITSRSLYRPVKLIQEDLQTLKEEKIRSRDKLKKLFLENLLLNRFESSREEQNKMLLQYNFKVIHEDKLKLVLLKIDNYRNFISQPHVEQRKIADTICNISYKIFSQVYITEVIKLEHDEIYILTGSDSYNNIILNETILNVQEEIITQLPFSVSAAVSEVESSIFEIYKLYNQVKRGIKQRFISGPNSILSMQEVEEMDKNDFIYPENLERKLTKELMSGNIDKVLETYMEIISEASTYSFYVLNFVLSRVVYVMHSAFKNMKKEKNLDYLEMDAGFLIDISEYENIEQVNDSILKLLESYKIDINNRKDQKEWQLVTRIDNFIDANYSNPMLSIAMIADQIKLSSAHIERIYKTRKMQTILDKITSKRMEAAKDLLSTTNDPITLISEKVGYNYNSYFSTAFKKKNGITPGEFRSGKDRK